MAYATDRFAAVDRLLVTVSTDRGFPGGPNGATLHSVWIVPARASLKAARPGLDTLRQVADTPTAQRTRAFTVAARAGDGGVHVSILRRLDLPKCAALFDLPVPRSGVLTSGRRAAPDAGHRRYPGCEIATFILPVPTARA